MGAANWKLTAETLSPVGIPGRITGKTGPAAFCAACVAARERLEVVAALLVNRSCRVAPGTRA